MNSLKYHRRSFIRSSQQKRKALLRASENVSCDLVTYGNVFILLKITLWCDSVTYGKGVCILSKATLFVICYSSVDFVPFNYINNSNRAINSNTLLF